MAPIRPPPLTEKEDRRLLDLYEMSADIPGGDAFSHIHDLAAEALVREIAVQRAAYLPLFDRVRYFARHPELVLPYLFRVRTVSSEVKNRFKR